MSQDPAIAQLVAAGFPRVSGDEPILGSRAWTSIKFSPRERG